MEVKPITETTTRLTGIIWGMSGCGKTTFLASLPRPILFIMLDPDGKDSLPNDDDIRILDLSSYDDASTVRACTDKIASFIAKEPDTTASVVVDSLTILAERGLNYAVEKGVGKSPKFTPSIEAPGLGAYGARRQYLTKTVANVLKATSKRNMHCFFTSHQGEAETDEKGNFLRITMMLGGKAVNDLGIKISECWWMREVDGKRFLALRNCRGREPMKTRMFKTPSPEFELKFDPDQGIDQPHSLTTWYNTREEKRKAGAVEMTDLKLDLPK